MDIKAARRLKHRAYVRLPAVALRHRAISPRDVFVLSYPRSGNTWVRFMLAHLVLGREPSFDDVFSHIPPVGRHRGAPGVLPDGGRLIKSHERPAPPHGSSYRRVVYLVRDGREVAVSYYDWYLRKGLYEGPFEGFLRLFLAGRLDGFGAWHEHVRSWLTSAPARANALLVVRYEDLLVRPTENLGRIAEFVGLDATPEQLEDALVSREQVEAALLARGPQARREWGEARGIARGSSREWSRISTPQDRELFQSAAGDVLAELGYARGEPPLASEPRPSDRGAHA
ncbi:MAG: sulfotransferase domain-containing protein [Solirubrobacterales bacterium]